MQVLNSLEAVRTCVSSARSDWRQALDVCSASSSSDVVVRVCLDGSGQHALHPRLKEDGKQRKQ